MARCKVGKCTPQEAGAAWNTGFQAGAANAEKGVANPRRSWAANLTRQKNTIAANLAQSFSNGSWESGVNRTGDQGWQKGMQEKGIPNMRAGSTRGANHYAAFRQQWDPAVQQMVASLPARGDFQQNKLRSTAMQDAMHAQKGKYRKLWRGGAV